MQKLSPWILSLALGGFLPLAHGLDVGSHSAPVWADLDNDRDLDLVIGEESSLRWLRNDGTLTQPAFTAASGAENPFANLQERRAIPAFGDLDGDGNLDLVVGNQNGLLGIQYNPLAGNSGFAPVADLDVGFNAAPALVDIDQDGDLEVFVGESDGTIHYFENTGGATQVQWEERTGVDNPLDGVDVGGYAHPRFVDFDLDGDQDVVIGNGDGELRYLANTGSAQAPRFGGDIQVPSESTPDLVDLDADGDLDLVIGDQDGNLHYFTNTGTRQQPDFVAQTSGANPFSGLVFRRNAPAFGDLDGDGDFDGVIGDGNGMLHYLENTGSANAPAFSEQTGHPLSEIDVGFQAAPLLFDLDHDEDLDLIVGDDNGNLHYFENTGDTGRSVFIQRTSTDNPFSGLSLGNANIKAALVDVDQDGDGDLFAAMGNNQVLFVANTGNGDYPRYGWNPALADLDDATPVLVDFDLDGDLDLFSGDNHQRLHYFHNQGSATTADFILHGGGHNPFDGIAVRDAIPAFGDFNGDGLTDAVVGDGNGYLHYYRNTGNAFGLTLTASTDASQGLSSAVLAGASDVGFDAAPTVVDWNHDGLLDLVVGDDNGNIHFYLNLSTSTEPQWIEQTGADNPFDGLNAGNYAKPVVADVTGDSVLDLVVGTSAGEVTLFRGTDQAFTRETLITTTANQHVAPTLGDLDGDGALDLVLGGEQAGFLFYRNHGQGQFSPFTPAEPTGPAAPLTWEVATASNLAVTAGDLDGDLDVDLLFGEDSGVLRYFANAGSQTQAQYTAATLGAGTATTNPFADIIAGAYAIPALADLDGDGDVDLLTGEKDGGLRYFVNDGKLTRTSLEGVIEAVKPTLEDFGVSAEKLPELTADQVQALPAESFTAFEEDTITAIPAEAAAGLTAEQIAKLAWWALRGLTVEQFAQLKKESLQGVNKENIGGFSLPVLAQMTAVDLQALNQEALKTGEEADISRIYTNLDPNKVQPAEVRDLLPEGWQVADNGAFSVPENTTLWFRELRRPADLPEQITLPEHQPDFHTGFALGGKTEGDTMLDELNDGLAQAGFGDLKMTQDDNGILDLQGEGYLAGARFSFLPDVNAMTQQGNDANPGVGQEDGGRFVLTTAKKQRFPLVPAPKDPQGLLEVLGGGDVGIDIGTLGDVKVSFPNANPNARAGSRIHFTAVFDSMVQPAPAAAAPGLLVQAEVPEAPLLMVYPDQTAQAIHPAVPQPDIFLSLARQTPGVTSAIQNTDGSFQVILAGATYRLTPTFDTNSRPLGSGETIAAALTINPDLTLDYTVEHNQHAITTRVMIGF